MRWMFAVLVMAVGVGGVVVGTVPVTAHAQEQERSPVITINPDGSFSVDQAAPPEPAKIKPAKVKKDTTPKAAAAPKQEVPKPVEPKPAKPKPDPAPEPAAESVFEPLDPIMPEVEKKVAPVPKKAEISKPAKKPAPKIVEAVPDAPPEPRPAEPRPAPVTQHSAPDPSGPVTPDDARRIAIKIGPAASRVDVYPADFNGLKVFQVIFKTEHGEEYILVERATGEIIREKPKGKKKR